MKKIVIALVAVIIVVALVIILSDDYKEYKRIMVRHDCEYDCRIEESFEESAPKECFCEGDTGQWNEGI